jgi:RNA polymerase sigma factor (sigma-70 family)
VTIMSLPDTAPLPVAAPPADLAELDDQDLLRLVHDEPAGSRTRAAACEVLVVRYELLVSSCARRYQGSPESTDEIKRHFRDRRWQVRVKRSAQELVLEMRTASADLAQQLQRTPTDDELARHLRVDIEDIRAARSADLGFSAWSLDAPLSDEAEAGSLAEFLGQEDPQMEHTVDMAALGAHWDELPRRQQRILLLRFYGNMTQAEIGQQLGLSQMHVSRLISQSLSYLRERMLGPDEAAPATGTESADVPAPAGAPEKIGAP